MRGARVLVAVTVWATTCLVPVESRAQPVVSRGDRVLSVDISAAGDGDFDAAFELVRSVGVGRIGVTLDWDMVEGAPRVYDKTLLEIINAYYAWKGVPIDLTLAPISTNVSVVPSDLRTRRWDDPLMIGRFKALLDFVFSQLPDVQLHSLVIGSEVEGVLITPTRRQQYAAFYAAVASYARTKRPGLRVAVEVGLDALVGSTASYYAQLNRSSNVIGVSHYPIGADGNARPAGAVATDFARLTARYPGRVIYFYQLGYPSATLLASSLQNQASFIREVFKAWDTHFSQIKMIDFTFLYDMDPADVAYFMNFYGLTGAKAEAFLSTLGLRTPNGAGLDKPGFTELKAQARARGW
jgi:hypothetical protein